MGFLLFWNGVSQAGGSGSDSGSTPATTTTTTGYPPYSSPGTEARGVVPRIKNHINALVGPKRTKQKRTPK